MSLSVQLFMVDDLVGTGLSPKELRFVPIPTYAFVSSSDLVSVLEYCSLASSGTMDNQPSQVPLSGSA